MAESGQDATERAVRYSDVAVLIPCYNEELTVGLVVEGFQRFLPGCRIYVADNASKDRTAEVARAAGATVLYEPHKGKGYAVRRLFADVDAECYILVDGDATYDPTIAHRLVEGVLEGGIDMVTTVRVTDRDSGSAYRRGHEWGNRALSTVFKRLFGLSLSDTLTGYRAFSRRFVKSFPGLIRGFEVETELNAHAATLAVTSEQVATIYRERPVGSESKLNTYQDGARILRRLLRLYRDYRPFRSFAFLSAPFLLATMLLLIPVINDLVETGLVPRFPSLIAAVGSFVIGINLLTVGAVLERSTRARLETTRLSYLNLSSSRRSVDQAAAAALRSA